MSKIRSGYFGVRGCSWLCATAVPAVLLLCGCGGMTAATGVNFKPVMLVISPDAAAGPDYVAAGSIDHADEVDYFQLELAQSFNTVVVMTTGDTDTAGRVETRDRTPISAQCEGLRHEAEPPCVWGSDADIDTPHADRSWKFNTMPASKNFLWEGSLDEGIYYIRVTGQSGSTGPYELTVELANAPCPPTETDPFGYYCN